jgi:hypothetical protein
MRISRALALFRPSVLASMMNLTEDDLIFTEKSLQRTLLVSTCSTYSNLVLSFPLANSSVFYRSMKNSSVTLARQQSFGGEQVKLPWLVKSFHY